MNFKETVGQNHIKVILNHEIASESQAHAYLFCGPRAVGKTTLARIMAKAINCLNRKKGQFEPCNKCDRCLEIINGRSLDIIEIDAASHTGVDNVRDNIIASARVTPTNSKYKVFIIDEVHMLSISAFNALLKVLEEPPEYVVFILCTTEAHKIPTTIISRCERFDFKRFSVNEISKRLQLIVNKEGVKIDKTILDMIARQAEGHMRDAESLLGQVIAIGGKEITPEEADIVIPRSNINEVLNLIKYLVKKDAGAGIGLINKLVDEGINLHRFSSDLIEILRKIMITKISPSLVEKLAIEFGDEIEAEITKIGQEMDNKQILIFIEKFIQARNELKGSFISQLPLEIAIAELCLASTVPRNFTAAQTGIPDSTKTKPISFQKDQKTVSQTADNLNKEIISSRWNEVLARIKKYNHSLSFILRVCEPRDINGNQLCLAFKYKFHKERIGDINIKKMVEKVLNEVYGSPLVIEAIIDEGIQANGQANGANGAGESGDDMMENLINTFGGKIIK
jgi:DNA polymerase-3 subunit gamma/tau